MRNVKSLKTASGITLIALVVTIVVLIILATISINAVLGENGLIRKAQQAKELHEGAAREEQEALNTLLGKYENALNGGGESGGSSPEPPEIKPTTPAGTELNTKPSEWTSTKVTPIADGKGGTIPLPNGFYYVGGDIDSGIVISDKEGDTINASGTSMGNQFVWIPVLAEEDLVRTDFDTTTGQSTNSLDAEYTEPYASGYKEEGSEYTTMHDQVIKYGGFYIGRFEAGINSEREEDKRTAPTTAQKVVCKKGVVSYNYVPWGISMSDASEVSGASGAVYLAKNFWAQERYTSVTSTLCYGCQWDAMCRYIEDSNRKSTKPGSVKLTGSVSEDVSKNIYDLAGSCSEWTMEASGTNSRVLRGGRYSHDYAVSFRGGGNTDIAYGNAVSFRPTLYIK